MRAGVFVVAVVLGALFPSMNRYRGWMRKTWPRRLRDGALSWVFGNVMAEFFRRSRMDRG